MGKYVNYYLENNARRLQGLTDRIIIKNFGWLPQMHYDDLMSIATVVVWDCEERYNKKKNTKFSTFLTGCLIRKFKSYITYLNRDKRTQKDDNGNPVADYSINQVIDEEKGVQICEILPDGNEDVFLKALTINDCFSDKMQIYIQSLTNQQRQIALLVADGYSPSEIEKMLEISHQRYHEQWGKMTSIKKTKVLCDEGR